MALSGYSVEEEKRIEQLLARLYEALDIQKPDDLFGSICVEVRYQNGKPIGQVDVQLKYVKKRTKEAIMDSGVRRRTVDQVPVAKRLRTP